jgi:hypothetical protein
MISTIIHLWEKNRVKNAHHTRHFVVGTNQFSLTTSEEIVE